jgi:nicotinate-nucleotide--dimethylbenzimidazole phosphoribosyltransferase
MPHSVLVLGGTRSGKSEFAEGLVNEATEVRYVATAAPAPDDDPEWAGRIAAHRARRPGHWTTEEIDSPDRLAVLLSDVKPDEAVLVDDLGGWLTGVLAGAEWSSTAVEEPVATLVAAVRDCPARTLVLVSPEVGLSVVPATPAGRAFVDAAGSTNRQLADVCAEVVLVVAGQPTRLKGAGPTATRPPAATPSAEAGPPAAEAPGTQAPATEAAEAAAPGEPSWSAAPGAVGALVQPTVWLPPVQAPPFAAPVEVGAVGSPLELRPFGDAANMELPDGLPLPSDSAATAAEGRIAALDVPGAGLGRLTRAVTFAAGARGADECHPYRDVRALVVYGTHEGGVAAGDDPGTWAYRVRRLGDGDGPIGMLAQRAQVRLKVVDVRGPIGDVVAGPVEHGDAMPPRQVDAAVRQGWEIAEAAVDEGADLLILAAAGPGQEAAAAAVVAASTSGEPAALLQRVYRPGGAIDDEAWMNRCAAIRDGMRRLHGRSRDARSLLSALGGPDIAVATGIVLGAASRRTPVVIDGPVGIAGALVARDIAGVARLWTVLADHGDHPTVKAGATALDLQPLVELRLGLGEGAASLAAVPLIQAALSIVDSA